MKSNTMLQAVQSATPMQTQQIMFVSIKIKRKTIKLNQRLQHVAESNKHTFKHET